MTRSYALVVAIVLLSGPVSARQQPQAGSDAISGSWGFDGRTLLELKADDGGSVTGTAYFYQGAGRFVLPIQQGRLIPRPAR